MVLPVKQLNILKGVTNVRVWNNCVTGYSRRMFLMLMSSSMTTQRSITRFHRPSQGTPEHTNHEQPRTTAGFATCQLLPTKKPALST